MPSASDARSAEIQKDHHQWKTQLQLAITDCNDRMQSIHYENAALQGEILTQNLEIASLQRHCERG